MMGPSCQSRKTRSTRKSSRRKTLFKNQPTNTKNQENPTSSPNMSRADEDCKDFENSEEVIMCSTPKAERYRIPEIETCPPAPKKRRMSTNNCSLKRTSISFFSHPDIELFFNFALCGVIPV
ncbi:hypothetical protein CASFOL_035306 [Castilleja foliolosa]|uniref:Uncharacterized protein n=1 Tax=Castilleja foliolosa TaxID=1961234 RepID=A0ABD3BTG9_9LAMI